MKCKECANSDGNLAMYTAFTVVGEIFVLKLFVLDVHVQNFCTVQ